MLLTGDNSSCGISPHATARRRFQPWLTLGLSSCMMALPRKAGAPPTFDTDASCQGTMLMAVCAWYPSPASPTRPGLERYAMTRPAVNARATSR